MPTRGLWSGLAARQRLTNLGGRLLGPNGPELTCEECFEHLDLYVELKVAGHDANAAIPRMQLHLEGCPACAEDEDSLHALVASERHPFKA